MNIALNLYDKYNHDILFIPIEMSWWDIMTRIVSNRTGVLFDKIVKPSRLKENEEIERRLSVEEIQKIKDAQLWLSRSNKFAILEVSEHVNVSFLRREIENRMMFFKPKIVVVDYVALMKPDMHVDRDDLAIGQMLKALRLLGRKYDFHIMSAAQIGRSTLTRLRQEGADSARPDSTSIRGSHDYSADADTIFALLPVPNEESQLRTYTIKARFGRKGVTKTLGLDAARCKIYSMDGVKIVCDPKQFDDDLNEPQANVAAELKKIKEPSYNSVKFDSFDIDNL